MLMLYGRCVDDFLVWLILVDWHGYFCHCNVAVLGLLDFLLCGCSCCSRINWTSKHYFSGGAVAATVCS